MLFLLFIVATLIELYVLISVGDAIGAFNTVLLVIVTAFIGSMLVRQQGFSTLRKVQQAATQNQPATFEMLEGVVILVSGLLLLTPGFITDFIGLLGLIPWTRSYFLNRFLQTMIDRMATNRRDTFVHPPKQKQHKNNGEKETIEGEFWRD